MDYENEDDRFQEIASSYGRVEAMLGTNAYHALVDSGLSKTDLIRAISNAIRIATLVGFLAAMPALVWLWKWALGA